MTKKKARSKRALLTVADYRRAARDCLTKSAWDYFRSGADDERTLRANERAFRRWIIWYRVLADVAERSLETTVLGQRVSSPILVAPTAYHKLACVDGELATTRAAAVRGTIYVASTLATTSLEDVAAATTAPKWFQLYVHKDRSFTERLVRRAEAAGYAAIVLTADTPLLGRRVRDERNGFALPEGMRMENLVEAIAESTDKASMLAKYVAARHDASLTFADFGWLRSLSALPLIIKGVVRADDARRCVDHGAAAILVSNHGGRQLDGAPATLDALPGIVDAVGSQCEVYLDGGIRRGTDVLKALALGARAVLVGRPVLWGLAANGEEGAAAILAILEDELSRAMALAGCPTIASIDRSLIAPAP